MNKMFEEEKTKSKQPMDIWVSTRDPRIDPQREREEWGHDLCQGLGTVGTLPGRFAIVFSVLGQVRTHRLRLTECCYFH